jgi:hypothetical protein
MVRFDINGVLYLMAGAALLLAILAAGRSLLRGAPARKARTFEVLTPHAAPLAHDAVGQDKMLVARSDRVDDPATMRA